MNKPSFLNDMQSPDIGAIAKAAACAGIEAAIWLVFVIIFNESAEILADFYLEDLPFVGTAFQSVAPDANGGHLVAMLLATFSIAVPIVIWSEVFSQRVLDDPQAWLCEKNNRAVAVLAMLVLGLTIGLEVTALYTTIAKEASNAQLSGGFVQAAPADDLMSFLAENKAYAIGVSIVIATVNIVMSMITVRTFLNLKNTSE